MLCENNGPFRSPTAGDEAPCGAVTTPVVFLGTVTPKFTGGLTGTVTVRNNLRFYALVDWKRGHKMLDTDGVNAFATPGGYIHITRGALALVQNEAELATVLGHEIGHVTEKHTIDAITKSRSFGAIAGSTRQEFLKNLANKAYEMTVENAWDRGDETGADWVGLVLAS